MALSAKLAMRQGQTMVLTPQLLQAIKLLQMPNLELTQFIENELANNPLLERAEEREELSPDPLDRADAEAAEAPAEPGDWAREALETDAAGLAANLGTEVDNAFDADRSAPALKSAPADGLTAQFVDGRRRRLGRRRSAGPRGLRRRDPVASRPSPAPGLDPHRRPDRAPDRRRADRRSRRGGILRGLRRRNRPASRRRPRSSSKAC